MKLSTEQKAEFKERVKPVMAFLKDHCHPHTSVIVTSTDAELLEGICCVLNKDPDAEKT